MGISLFESGTCKYIGNSSESGTCKYNGNSSLVSCSRLGNS